GLAHRPRADRQAAAHLRPVGRRPYRRLQLNRTGPPGPLGRKARRVISRSRCPGRLRGMRTGAAEGTVHPRWLLGVLLTAPFMQQADVTIVNAATPSIHASLGASGAELELVVGGYLIALAMLLITGARLGQAFGYRRVFVAGVSLFTLASLACGLAP